MTADSHEQPCIFKPGDVILERHKQARERRVDAVYNGWINTTGIASGRQTAIDFKNLKRYRKVAWP
jgi:hypothetical protein